MNIRNLKGSVAMAVGLFAVCASLFHLYTSGFGVLEPRAMRSLHLLFLVPLVFIMFPPTSKASKETVPWYDWILAILAFAASAYSYWHADRINFRYQGVSDLLPMELFLGTVIILLVIEATRRLISKWFALVPLVFLAYLILAPYAPGILKAKAYSYPRIVEMMYLFVDEGIYGFLMGLSANVLYIYVLFAVFMVRCGVGDYLIELAHAFAGGLRGGPAKIAVLASALYGSVSGSTVANVYATGSVTIPMMKRIGYKPKTAAAIEAAASTGGQIMPPIMGVGAFVMAELTGVPYTQIIKIAFLPALLFYFGVMSMVHFEAVKANILPDRGRERPNWSDLLKRSFMVTPFMLIAVLLIYGYSPSKSAFFCVLLTAFLGFFNPKKPMNFQGLVECFKEGAFTAAQIAIALASAGIVVTVMTRTGAALSFSSMVIHASGGNLFPVLIMIFAAVAILGAGIPTTAAYIIAVTVGAAALGELGVALITSHLFVFYYAVFSDLTPPVAVTAYAAATLSGSEMMATGIEAFKLALSGFIVPFVFVYHPEILWQGTALQAFISFLYTALAIFCLSIAIVGYMRARLNIIKRLVLFAAAVLLIMPAVKLQFLGGALALAGLGAAFLVKPSRQITPSL